MRFFEYESRAIVARAGIPVTKHGLARTPAEARTIATEIAGPVVIKSQVLAGGRMKAGGVQFADTPEEAARQAAHVLELKIGGAMPRGVLVDSRAAVAHEYYAGVAWDGLRKRPVMLFSDMGGIDIEEVADQHPDHVARGYFSPLRELPDWRAKPLLAELGVGDEERVKRARPPRSSWPARRSTPRITAAWPATSPNSTATLAW
jgi:succinyl-CoA synthetase beta subunit